MTNLMRRSANAPLSLREAMDRLIEDSFVGFGTLAGGTAAALPVDLTETDDEIVVKVAVPGVKPEDLNVSVTGDMLTISAETRDESEAREERDERPGQRHYREWYYGRVERTLRLPVAVNSDAAQAECSNGVLTLRLPKAENVRPRAIKVTSK
jgi:HSP20 family protein